MADPALKALIVDDEPLARKGLRKLLGAHPDFTVAGECPDGQEAVRSIEELRPDVVFLDIQMPGLDGFGVVEAIGVDAMPVTVFITAYDQHAMRAFDVHAVDYLLKPVTPERLSVALGRVRSLCSDAARPAFDRKIRELMEAVRPPGDALKRFIIRSVGRVSIVPVADVDLIEADGDYVRLHVAGKSHLLREKMSVLESRLDPSEFVRIHRSTIVRIRSIRELRPLVNGDHVVILRDGRQFSLSRTMRERVFRVLESGR